MVNHDVVEMGQNWLCIMEFPESWVGNDVCLGKGFV